jgi:uncharacterized protein DUF4169
MYPPENIMMAELVNLRTARKHAKRRKSNERAQANRLAHGQPKRLREFEDAQQKKANSDLDLHKIETEDRR